MEGLIDARKSATTKTSTVTNHTAFSKVADAINKNGGVRTRVITELNQVAAM